MAKGDELMVAHHDDEWGTPSHDDRHLFEMLTLEGAQAGLSWSTILRKREGYRRAFADFDPGKVARFGSKDVERLLADPGIVRNRLKVESTVEQRRPRARRAGGAREPRRVPVVVRRRPADRQPGPVVIRASGRDRPLEDDLEGPEATRLPLRRADDLIYAFMQSVGMVDDHTVDCFRRSP